ncbi:MAG: NAD(P)H-hydrate epimerase [Coriobacteriia bacterium]|nr:NAD(P)H-hydrate epimerase [Coriobacteriia bacterium]MCL2749510.1 NAD(P)H-hydrate epimerase [Coriobacteriia bacterium]
MENKVLGPVLSVTEVIALEKQIEAEGTSLYELMNRAGLSVAEWVCKTLDPPELVLILCGSGNNGGDGWVIADYLCSWGYSISLVTAKAADDLRAEPARRTALEVQAKGHAGLSVNLNPDEEQLTELIEQAAVVVDALLGTGFDGSVVKEPYASWIQAVNAARASSGSLQAVAVDVPSGLSADTGRAAPTTIQADTTITMLAYKPGLLETNSEQYCGNIILARIGTGGRGLVQGGRG